MEVVYVSDNRTAPNWGGRSTSIALAQILTQQHKIISTIDRSLKLKTISIKSLLPSLLSNFAYRRRNTNILCRAWVGIDSAFGAELDYVTKCPEESVQNLLSYKHKYSELEEIFRKIEHADVVVINGEGNMIFNPARRSLFFLLMIIELAYKLDKKVLFVNAMVSECPVVGQDRQMVEASVSSLHKCKYVALRDPYSVRLLKEIDPTVKSNYIPDALFSWSKYYTESQPIDNNYIDMTLVHPTEKTFDDFDFSEPYICVGGSSLAARNQKEAGLAYLNLVNRLKDLKLPICVVAACTGDSFLKQVSLKAGVPFIPVETPILLAGKILAGARLFVSGRYHPSILASLGGTPCIFLSSNSHKTRSLQEVLGYGEIVEFSAVPTFIEINNIFEVSKHKISTREVIRDKITTQVKHLSEESEKLKNIVN